MFLLSYKSSSTNSKLHAQKDFEQLRIQRTKDYFREQCVPVTTMVRPPPVAKIISCSGSHLNVGEWVEIVHSYEVGTCSEGGIAIVTKFEAGKADVRYYPFLLTYPCIAVHKSPSSK